MPATPAEVANDLAAQAKFFVKRDDAIARLCADAASLIRSMIEDKPYDEVLYATVLARIAAAGCDHRCTPKSQIEKSLHRAFLTITVRPE